MFLSSHPSIITSRHALFHSPDMDFQIVLLCEAPRARIVGTNVRLFAGMRSNVDGELSGSFEGFVALVAGLRNFHLWLWAAFLLLLRHFFDVSITVSMACNGNTKFSVRTAMNAPTNRRVTAIPFRRLWLFLGSLIDLLQIWVGIGVGLIVTRTIALVKQA